MQFLEKRKTYNDILEEIFRDALKERLGRFLSEQEILYHREKDLIIGWLLKTGKISLSYVMRKFQCTCEEATKKISEATKHECPLCSRKEINYFDAEFEVCKCFGQIAT